MIMNRWIVKFKWSSTTVITNLLIIKHLFTAHIRRMGEGTVFSLFVSPHLGGGGTPVRSREVPHPRSGWGEGVPHPRSGWGVPQVPPTRSGWGTPLPLLGQDGVPPRPGMGYPPDLGQGTPQTWDRVPPDLGHSEHLLRGGRYASCVHAEGLSCSRLYLKWIKM